MIKALAPKADVASFGNEPLIIPNHSGDHSAGKQLKTPVNDNDLVNKKYVDDHAGGGCSFGTDNQIPYTNAAGDDFDYSSVLTFDETDLKLKGDDKKMCFGAGEDYSIEYTGSEVMHMLEGQKFFHTTSTKNVFIGKESGKSITSAQKSVGIGEEALESMTTGGFNVAIGDDAGKNVTTGTNNVLIGTSAGSSSFAANLIIGSYAGTVANSENVHLGAFAGRYNTASGNFFLGDHSGFGVSGSSSGGSNVAIGRDSLRSLTTGAYNVVIGDNAGKNITTGGSNVVIGYTAGNGQITTQSDLLWIENSNASSPLIYGEFDNDFVRINGKFKVKSDGTNDATHLGWITGSADPTTTEIPNDHEYCIYENTTSGNIFLAVNDGGTIKKVQFT